MDKWFDDQLKKMEVNPEKGQKKGGTWPNKLLFQLGGNKKAREFFESQADYSPNWTQHDKYNSRCASLYREKVPS